MDSLSSENKRIYIFYLPYWSDIIDPYINKFNEKYVVNKHIFERNKSYVYDYVKEQKMLANFNLILFTITKNKKNTRLFGNLVNMIKNNDD